MMIHSDVIEYHHLREAAALAGVSLERDDQSGSRSRDHKFDVILSGESGRRTNQRWGYGDSYAWEAATWDQWGIFLAYLFEVDPDAFTRGGGNYNGQDDFDRQTGGRFERDAQGDSVVHSQSSPDYKITAHRWQYDYETMTLTCKGHSAAKNMRAECKAVLNRG